MYMCANTPSTMGPNARNSDVVHGLMVAACRSRAELRAIPSMREHARHASFGETLDGQVLRSLQPSCGHNT